MPRADHWPLSPASRPVAVSDSVRNYFGWTTNTPSRPLLNVLENKLYAVCFQHLAAIIDVQRTPFTQNTEYLICCKENWLAKYKDANFGKGKVPAAKAKVPVLSEFSTPVISRSTPKQVRDAFRSPSKSEFSSAETVSILPLYVSSDSRTLSTNILYLGEQHATDNLFIATGCCAFRL